MLDKKKLVINNENATSLLFLYYIVNLFKYLFQMPIVILIKNAERIISVLTGIFLIAIGILILTPLGFPYSGNPLSLAPQRFMIAVKSRI